MDIRRQRTEFNPPKNGDPQFPAPTNPTVQGTYYVWIYSLWQSVVLWLLARWTCVGSSTDNKGLFISCQCTPYSYQARPLFPIIYFLRLTVGLKDASTANVTVAPLALQTAYKSSQIFYKTTRHWRSQRFTVIHEEEPTPVSGLCSRCLRRLNTLTSLEWRKRNVAKTDWRNVSVTHSSCLWVALSIVLWVSAAVASRSVWQYGSSIIIIWYAHNHKL
jgi:hypothetical protein